MEWWATLLLIILGGQTHHGNATIPKYFKRDHVCPKSFRLYDNGICYLLVSQESNISASVAKTRCAKYGGFLPEPISPAENYFLYINFVVGRQAIPLGIDDENEEKTFKYQKLYRHLPSIQFDNYKHAKSVPGNSESRDCVYMKNDSRWSVIDCHDKTASLGLVCQGRRCPVDGEFRLHFNAKWESTVWWLMAALATVTLILAFFRFRLTRLFECRKPRRTSRAHSVSVSHSRRRSSSRRHSIKSKTSSGSGGSSRGTMKSLPSYTGKSRKRASIRVSTKTSPKNISSQATKPKNSLDLGELAALALLAKNKPKSDHVYEEYLKMRDKLQTSDNQQDSSSGSTASNVSSVSQYSSGSSYGSI